jgi:hypothetical protein
MQGLGWKLKGISASFEKGRCLLHSVDVGIKPVLLKCSGRKMWRDKVYMFKWLNVTEYVACLKVSVFSDIIEIKRY